MPSLPPIDRAGFPILERRIGKGEGRPLVYLDSAATALVPERVVRAVERFYATSCANIHRGAHVLAEEATAEAVPRVSFDDEATLPLRLETAIGVADAAAPSRIAVELPGTMWEDAGEGRSAQHFAITLLDALCSALS